MMSPEQFRWWMKVCLVLLAAYILIGVKIYSCCRG